VSQKRSCEKLQYMPSVESGYDGTDIGLGIGAKIQYDYNNTSTSKKSNYSVVPPSFNRDATQFSW